MDINYKVFWLIQGGNIDEVIQMIDTCETDDIELLATSFVSHLCHCHQSQEHLDELLFKIKRLISCEDISFYDINTAYKKEQNIVMYLVRAHEVHNESYAGLLDILSVRDDVVRKRLEKYGSEMVIESEERYSIESMHYIARHALSWHYITFDVLAEKRLVEEVVRYLLWDMPKNRIKEYERILSRRLFESESEVFDKYTIDRARRVTSWIEIVIKHGKDTEACLDKGLEKYIDILINRTKEQVESYYMISKKLNT